MFIIDLLVRTSAWIFIGLVLTTMMPFSNDTFLEYFIFSSGLAIPYIGFEYFGKKICKVFIKIKKYIFFSILIIVCISIIIALYKYEKKNVLYHITDFCCGMPVLIFLSIFYGYLISPIIQAIIYIFKMIRKKCSAQKTKQKETFSIFEDDYVYCD